MQEADLRQIFLESADEVLGAMFFTAVSADACEEPGVDHIAAELAFRGSPCGRFGIELPAGTARVMAANFLGLEEDEISASQIDEVACELTNIICGSVLSRIEADARFELDHPKNTTSPEPDNAFRCTFGLDEGSLTVWMATGSSDLRRN
jgi:Chemotaxis phosphatase CheX